MEDKLRYFIERCQHVKFKALRVKPPSNHYHPLIVATCFFMQFESLWFSPTQENEVSKDKNKGGRFLKKSGAGSVGQSERRRANARNFSFETLYDGQFTLSTQSIKPNYLAKQTKAYAGQMKVSRHNTI